MKVGDLVRVGTDWGGNGTVGLIIKVHEDPLSKDKEMHVITLNTMWEYR